MRTVLCLTAAILLASAGNAPAQPFFAGFNDAVGLNSNPTPNSPYNVNNTSIFGQGTGEPGWATTWQGGGAVANVVNSGQAEGDGAMFMQGTVNVLRGLSLPLTGTMSIEMQLRIPTGAVTGIGATLYGKQFSNNATGPQLHVSTNGHIYVIDGIEDGNLTPPLLDTGFTWFPGIYQTYRMDVNTVTRTWEFYFNGSRFNSPTPLGYRDAPVFIDAVQFLNEINGPNGTFIDNLRVGAVPEPSSLALLGIASAAGLARWRRKRGN